ncbi:hypothetical protein F4814DRAFT_447872 [Daldinia grandis]|nr:hypothetical protein F4814DRAFT_447872 [Daldinia grandis]
MARYSFRRCAAELGLLEQGTGKQESGSVLEDSVVQIVLQWLRDRTEVDSQWLVIIDNADDFTWGIKKILPSGSRGSMIITSQDDESGLLIAEDCETLRVGDLSASEGTALLLKHLKLDIRSVSSEIRLHCNKVSQKLGYLALAIDLAGAYIRYTKTEPGHALMQYLADYDRHSDRLLKWKGFQGLMPTEKTVWTVWDTTLEKLGNQYPDLQLDIFLTFLAHFKGSVVPEEMFRLASVGIAEVDAELDEMDETDDGTTEEGDKRLPEDFRQFLSQNDKEWDSLQYRQSRDVKRPDRKWSLESRDKLVASLQTCRILPGQARESGHKRMSLIDPSWS